MGVGLFDNKKSHKIGGQEITDDSVTKPIAVKSVGLLEGDMCVGVVGSVIKRLLKHSNALEYLLVWIYAENFMTN